MPPELIIQAGQHSDAGVKPVNEDSCGIRNPDAETRVIKGVALVIADGMSGSEAGREASESCVQSFLSDYYSTPDSWSVEHAGGKVLGAINRWLFGQGQQRFQSAHGMVTTFSALVLKSTTAYLFHVGDTRIYRSRNGEWECLTRDHRVRLSEEKEYLSRAMGIEAHVDIDFRTLPLEQGDRFLLTTDGIHDFIPERELSERLAALAEDADGQTLEDVARGIVARARENGSDDNLTCQVVQVQQLPGGDEEEFYRKLTELPFPPDLKPGMVLDGYKIIRELHASNRTQVYLALDTRADRPDQRVVIKTPSVNYEDDPDYIDQFLHEEWAGRRLDNHHILKVLDPGRRRQCLYYVTEFIEGQTLRQWMHDNPQAALVDVRNIVAQISAGLRAFHRMEMLHQDLKPDNILIDSHGTVKLIDFGSTKIAGIQEISTPLARDAILGTRDYTAPEYLMGYPGSNRSDIFSLAVITYEMLTGKLPYGEDVSLRKLQRRGYLRTINLNPEVPAWMDAALEKALQIDPGKRYSLLSEFVQDINHPNPDLIKDGPRPLLERNPLGFWRASAIILFILNLLLAFKLLT